MDITGEGVGLAIWAVWILIGVFAGMVTARVTGPGTRAFDVIIGIAGAVIGGYVTTCYIGSTPLQLFLVSLLGAIFFSAAALWIAASLMAHYRKK